MLFRSIALVFAATFSLALASHSWGGYHWARTSNPFTLKLGDNLSNNWKSYLATASKDWSLSQVLDTTVVTGNAGKNCRPTFGRVEVCSNRYGNNGWLGIAQIWVNGSHIAQGITKMNDTYFATPTYNNPAWKQFVMCQEVGHTFGLDHQDEIFNNVNLGTCMDYTNDPDGKIYGQLSNLSTNSHDYQELDLIYTHTDTTTTISQVSKNGNAFGSQDEDNKAQWGKSLKKNIRGKDSLFEKDFGKGEKVFTFVIWAD